MCEETRPILARNEFGLEFAVGYTIGILNYQLEEPKIAYWQTFYFCAEVF